MKHRRMIAAIAGLILLTGCSGFNREWRRAAQATQWTNNFAGRWEGFWMSEHNGHNGRLRCLITGDGEGPYDAWFHAKYRKVLSFGYVVPLKVEQSNGLFRFVGEANLGKLAGGVYQYEGTATGTNFHSTYRCKYDYGYFRLNRAH